ncbi:carotenoid oxygenase family protein [Microlunatus speluncae]|uniref:carotenoid oxygenase family protein n=1 Tax=Microlunatus speluncae TaxID=2594267 RepID=UPI0012661A9A|nr:carotenoid oxygenase family protein [Microlunatus speluncae]
MTVHEEIEPAAAEEQFHLTGNYAPVPDEIDAVDLPVTGELPAELSGRYLRNGPNPRSPNDHWFTGDGMVHGVRISGGRARWYRNRFVRTDSFEHPFPLYDPADGSRQLRASVANTHVVRHAGKLLALVESSLPYEIDAELNTLGCHDFGGRLRDSMTAHPKICPTTGELHFFGYGNLREPYVTYHRADAAGELIIDQPVDVPGLTMMHDFCLTADYVIFLDLPVVFRLDLAMAGSGMPYRWSDEYGARLGVMRRDDPAAPVRWFEIAPCYVFHVANAHQAGDKIMITAARYASLWSDGAAEAKPQLWEWALDLGTGQVAERQLDDTASEFPRIDDRLTGLPASSVYTCAEHDILHYDLGSGRIATHRFGTGEPGEATFVPSADGPGYLMTYVYRPETDRSDLVVLDAGDVSAPPVAAVHLPRRVPNGFHGNWFDD